MIPPSTLLEVIPHFSAYLAGFPLADLEAITVTNENMPVYRHEQQSDGDDGSFRAKIADIGGGRTNKKTTTGRETKTPMRQTDIAAALTSLPAMATVIVNYVPAWRLLAMAHAVCNNAVVTCTMLLGSGIHVDQRRPTLAICSNALCAANHHRFCWWRGAKQKASCCWRRLPIIWMALRSGLVTCWLHRWRESTRSSI